MRRRPQLAVPFVVAALALGAAGCGSDSPKPGPVAKSSAESTTPPTVPADASGPSASAGSAFIRHYFDSLGYATATGDTAALRKLGAQTCESCDGVATQIEKIYSSGGRVTGRGYSADQTQFEKAKNRYRVDFKIYPQKTVATAGAKPVSQPAVSIGALFYLRHNAGGWQITNWTRL